MTGSTVHGPVKFKFKFGYQGSHHHDHRLAGGVREDGGRVSESQHLQILALGGLDSVRDRPRETCRFAGSRDEGVDSQVRSTVNGMQRRSQWQRRLGGGSAALAATALAVWSIDQCCSRKLRRSEMLRRPEVDFTLLPSCRHHGCDSAPLPSPFFLIIITTIQFSINPYPSISNTCHGQHHYRY